MLLLNLLDNLRGCNVASCRFDLNLNNWKKSAHFEAGLGSCDSDVLAFEDSDWDSSENLKKSSRTVSGE